MSSHILAVKECLIGDRHNAEIKTVSELVSASKIFVEDGNHGENRPRQDEFCYQGNGIPFLRPPDLKEGRVDFRNCDFIIAQGFARVRKGIGKPGDVILTHRATVGRITITGSDAPTVFVTNPGTTIWRSLDKDLLDQRYLYFYMSSRIFQDRLFSEVGHTSTFDYVSLTQQRTLPVVIPEIRLQRQIAHILGTLDDKIELNRKTNETLEAMAKSLFKSWFVDFDPVRAKAEGRPTGLPAEISDLFPDSFEDSELGEIPTGWKVGTIASSVGEVFDGPHATPKEAEEGNVFLGIKNMIGSSLNLSDVKLIGHDDWSQWTRRVEPRADDIVFTYEAALGLFAVIPHGLKCCLGRRMALIRTKAPNGAPHFWFHQFIAKPFQKVIEERSIHGATVNRTPLTEFPGYPILEPPENLRLAFDHTVSSLWARINAAANQTSSLTSLRDTLLPKLISGELRIPDAEKMLENFLS